MFTQTTSPVNLAYEEMTILAGIKYFVANSVLSKQIRAKKQLKSDHIL